MYLDGSESGLEALMQMLSRDLLLTKCFFQKVYFHPAFAALLRPLARRMCRRWIALNRTRFLRRGRPSLVKSWAGTDRSSYLRAYGADEMVRIRMRTLPYGVVVRTVCALAGSMPICHLRKESKLESVTINRRMV